MDEKNELSPMRNKFFETRNFETEMCVVLCENLILKFINNLNKKF